MEGKLGGLLKCGTSEFSSLIGRWPWPPFTAFTHGEDKHLPGQGEVPGAIRRNVPSPCSPRAPQSTEGAG